MSIMINVDKPGKAGLIHPEKAMESVLSEIDTILRSTPPVIREYTSYLAESKGKNIRAMCLITCAENDEGMVHPNAVRAAAAIELIHLASLVHDDVIDDADLRRGRETLHRKYGRKTAVICGDYLFTLALKLAGKVTDRKDYLDKEYLDLDIPSYMERLALGELSQHINNWNIDLTEVQYLKIISGKTAALFEASFHAGAIISKCDKNTIKKYMKLGKLAGIIFQIMDDCMNFVETEDAVKKPVRSDFEQGVITLPLIYALRTVKGLKERISENRLSSSDINEIVLESGGIEYARGLAGKYYKKSMELIDGLKVPMAKRNKLNSILDRIFGQNGNGKNY